MKKLVWFFVVLFLLVLFAFGCAGAQRSVNWAREPTVEHGKPTPPLTPPPTPAVPISTTETTHTTASAPELDSASKTLRFVWSSDPSTVLKDASIPNIIRLDDGKFRLYYSGPGGILSAISKDGLSFTKENGVRISSGGNGTDEMIVSDPAALKLNDGRMRMYYKGATGFGGPGQAVHSIFSAISSDGLHFKKEGKRIDSLKTSDDGWASVPDAILLPSGKVRIYYVSNGDDVLHGIVSALSEDGLNFTREGPVLTGFVDPAIIRLTSGEYLMVAVSFPMSSKGRLTDARPGIYSFTSTDGIKFTNRLPVLLGENNIDPAVIEISPGTYRVFYWNLNEERILSLTGTRQ